MILFNIYLLLFVIVALALAAVYQFLWRPLVRIKAERGEIADLTGSGSIAAPAKGK